MIKNVKIYGLEESLIASGYPMTHGVPPEMTIDMLNDGSTFKRGRNLGRTPAGSGHDCFLKGITVQFDWTISQTIFPQVERYHFIDIVSSQSKMHRLQLAEAGDFHPSTDPLIVDRFMKLVDQYNSLDPIEEQVDREEMFETIVYSVPMGYQLTARFTTNYLQLKTIYKQRKKHKLKEWREFCQWIETLPNFKAMCLKK